MTENTIEKVAPDAISYLGAKLNVEQSLCPHQNAAQGRSARPMLR